MYYKLDPLYKIGFSIQDKPKYHALFCVVSTGGESEQTPFEADSIVDLVEQIHKHLSKLIMSRRFVHAKFNLKKGLKPEDIDLNFSETRSYTDKGGVPTHITPFSLEEEKEFLELLISPQ